MSYREGFRLPAEGDLLMKVPVIYYIEMTAGLPMRWTWSRS